MVEQVHMRSFPADLHATPPVDAPNSSRSQLRQASVVLAFALAYLAGGGVSQWIATPGTGISLWPPAGIYVAALLLTPPAAWPVMAGAALASELVGNVLWWRNPLAVALVLNGANAVHAVSAALLMRRFSPAPFDLKSVRQVMLLLLLGAGLTSVLSATIGAATLALAEGQRFAPAWLLWWIGDATGVLIAAPVVLVVCQSRIEPPTVRVALETAGLVIALVAVVWLALGGLLPFAFIVMPALLWAAIRFEQKGAVLTLVLLTVTTAVLTASGLSPFSGDVSTQREKNVMLQLFLAISAVTSLVVAAVSSEQKLAWRRLRVANADLEARVAERTSQLAAALRAGRLGVLDYDVSAGLITWDTRATELWGDATPVNLADIEAAVVPEDRALLLAEVTRALSAGPPSRFAAEFRLDRGGEDPRWIRAEGDVLFEDGRPVRLIGTVQDISERKAAQQRIEASEQLLSSIYDGVNSAIAISEAVDGGRDFRILSVNRACLEWSGVPAERWIGRSPRDVLPPRDADGVLMNYRRALAARGPIAYEELLALPAGSIAALTTVSPVPGPEGCPPRVVATSIDITQRVRAEHKLKQSEERFRLASEAAGAMVYDIDTAGRRTSHVRGLTIVTGYDERGLDVSQDWWEARVHPSDLERYRAYVASHLAGTPSARSLRYRFRHAAGGWRTVEDAVQVIRGERGQPARIVGTLVDVSERQRNEERQVLLINELSHRVKNTLATVQSIAIQSLRDCADRQAVGTFVSRLVALGRGHDLLAGSRWEGADLADVIDRATASLAGNEHLVVVPGPPLWLPPRHALAMTLAIHELCTNALKYGALSVATGMVVVSWTLSDGWIEFHWDERDGPPVQAPSRRGFGSRLLEKGLRQDLDGVIRLDFAPAGLQCVARFRLVTAPPAELDIADGWGRT
jgi:PAS domain S-box-containing protein